MEIAVLSVNALSPEQRQHICGWLREAFIEDITAYQWSEPDWHVMIHEDGRLVCHVDITERTAMVGGQPVRLGGVGGVITLPEYRRRGLATAALQQADAFMHDPLAVEFGLLMCDPAMTSFYCRLGWQTVEEPLVFAQAGGKVDLQGAVMILPCQKQAWPCGPIDLCGLPW